jgi:hypothetical protein
MQSRTKDYAVLCSERGRYESLARHVGSEVQYIVPELARIKREHVNHLGYARDTRMKRNWEIHGKINR